MTELLLRQSCCCDRVAAARIVGVVAGGILVRRVVSTGSFRIAAESLGDAAAERFEDEGGSCC